MMLDYRLKTTEELGRYLQLKQTQTKCLTDWQLLEAANSQPLPRGVMAICYEKNLPHKEFLLINSTFLL